MLLDAVIIVLREVLEAAILSSILLAISRYLALGKTWFLASLATGLIVAFVYAQNLPTVSQWFDYTGQEIINGFIQIGIFSAVLGLILVLAIQSKQEFRRTLKIVMGITLTLAICREGAEILLYLGGFLQDSHKFLLSTIGGAIGTAIGLSVGVLVFYGLGILTPTRALIGCQLALAWVVAGIVGQAVPLFEQIDWLPSSAPLWDSSSWLPENSILGQLLYAVLGYEATPSPIHVLVHLGALLSASGVLMWSVLHRNYQYSALNTKTLDTNN